MLRHGATFLSFDKIAIAQALYDVYPALSDLPPDYAAYNANETASLEKLLLALGAAEMLRHLGVAQRLPEEWKVVRLPRLEMEKADALVH